MRVKVFLDPREREVRKVGGKQGEQNTADQGEVGEGAGVAGAGAVFAPEGVTAPMVADLDAGPVALDEGEPLRRGVRVGLGTGEVVAHFVAGAGGARHRAGAAHDDQGARVGEVDFERFNGEGVDPTGDDPAVAGIGEEKKGVWGWA